MDSHGLTSCLKRHKSTIVLLNNPVTLIVFCQSRPENPVSNFLMYVSLISPLSNKYENNKPPSKVPRQLEINQRKSMPFD